MDISSFKLIVYNFIQSELLKREVEISQNIDSIRLSRDSDTKSSAGDKYETSREMAQIELEKSNTQLKVLQTQKQDLSRIKFDNKYQQVAHGAFIQSKDAYYFIAIGLGKLIIENKTVYAISALSPLGKAMMGKKINDEIVFNNSSIKLLDIA